MVRYHAAGENSLRMCFWF